MKCITIKHYRDFWDVPRLFLASKGNYLLLFDCKFNEMTEDYEERYEVFIMPELKDSEIKGSWSHLSEKAVKYLGEIPVNEVTFDETRRKFIESAIISKTFGACGLT